MRVLVTGGSGFIGTNYVQKLLQEKVEVLNLDAYPPRNELHHHYWARCDILERGQLAELVARFSPTHVVHLAARTGTDINSLQRFKTNIDGVRNLLEVLGQVPSVQRVIFTSSTLVCRIGYTPKHDTDYCPTTVYGQSKVEGEQIVRNAGSLPFIWTIVRPVSIWGPWGGSPYFSLFKAISRGWYFHAGACHYQKSLGYVGNTVHQLQSLLMASSEKVHGRTMYLADDPPIDLRQFTETIQQELGSRRIISLPLPGMRFLAKIGDLLKAMGWRYVPLTSFRLNNITTEYVYDLRPIMEVAAPLPYGVRDGVRGTIDWLHKSGRSDGSSEDPVP